MLSTGTGNLKLFLNFLGRNKVCMAVTVLTLSLLTMGWQSWCAATAIRSGH